MSRSSVPFGITSATLIAPASSIGVRSASLAGWAATAKYPDEANADSSCREIVVRSRSITAVARWRTSAATT